MITIKTLEVPGALGLKAVVSKIRNLSGCGTDPDGYFTYHEIPNKGSGDRYPGALVPSQYFLGEGDIGVVKGFLKPTGQNFVRRKQWIHAIEGLYAEFEITAPITFWALNGFRDLMIDMDMNPVWDLSNYGKVPAEEFLEGLMLTGHAAFNYYTLTVIRWKAREFSNALFDALVPWIEQLPYADIFICNENMWFGSEEK